VIKFVKKDRSPNVNIKNKAVFSYKNPGQKLKYRQFGARVLKHANVTGCL